MWNCGTAFESIERWLCFCWLNGLSGAFKQYLFGEQEHAIFGEERVALRVCIIAGAFGTVELWMADLFVVHPDFYPYVGDCVAP